MSALTPAPPKPLTPHGRRIVELIAAGRSNAEVGKEVGMSFHSVSYDVRLLLRRHGARTRAELVAIAYRTGLVAMPAGSTPRVAR